MLDTFDGYNVSQAAIYTVVVTDNITNCTATAVQTIYGNPNISISSVTYPTSCVNPSSTATINLVSSGTYPPFTLSAVPTTNVVNINSVPANAQSVTVNASSFYTITTTDSMGCKNHVVVDVTQSNSLKFCCFAGLPPSTVYLTNPNNTNISATNNQTYYIDGIYTVSSNITFTNCQFYFTPNAQISIANGVTLTLDSCKLQAGCDTMWKGIYTDSNLLQENLVVKNSLIEDMEQGIVIQYNSKMHAENNIFADNYQSMLIGGNTDTAITVIKNTFIGQDTLKYPYDYLILPKYGIRLGYNESLFVGSKNGNPSEGNHFQNLWNGVYVDEDGSNYKYVSGYSSGPKCVLPIGFNYEVVFKYNTFSNINGGVNVWDQGTPANNVFNNSDGAAIFVNGSLVSYSKVFVHGNNLTTPYNSYLVNFNNCNKMLVGKNSDLNLYRNKGQSGSNAGLLANDCWGHIIECGGNIMNDVVIGAYKIGDEGFTPNNVTGHFNVNNNNITLKPNPVAFTTPNQYSYGVRSEYFTNSSLGKTVYWHDTITIPFDDFGIGLQVANGTEDYIQNFNRVYFNGAGTPASNPTINWSALYGIYLNNCSNTTVNYNLVKGSSSGGFLTNSRISGIYLENSTHNYTMNCNHLSNLTFGIAATGDNSCGADSNINNNIIETSNSGLLMRVFVNQGNLGNIGLNTQLSKKDNNNTFVDLTGTNYRVHRLIDTNIPPIAMSIVTAPLNLSAFSFFHNVTTPTTNQPNYKVNLQNPSSFNYTYLCSPPQPLMLENQGSYNDLFHALLIANDEIEYVDYPEGGRWLDENMLYTILRQNPDLRDENPILNNYYNARQYSKIGRLKVIDEQIAALSDSALLANRELWEEKLYETVALNDELDYEDIFVVKEKFVNDVYLRKLLGSESKITENDWLELDQLANSCPYIYGKATFKARALVAPLNPAKRYDDMYICNNVGVYKGENKYSAQNSNLFVPRTINNNGVQALPNSIEVYPNPASSYINIKYNIAKSAVAEFSIKDIYGRTVNTVHLRGSNNYVTFKVNDLSKGIYFYNFTLNNVVIKSDKLVIE